MKQRKTNIMHTREFQDKLFKSNRQQVFNIYFKEKLKKYFPRCGLLSDKLARQSSNSKLIKSETCFSHDAESDSRVHLYVNK